MGIPAENFVEPEKISRQFFCAICTDVVSDPVETCYGHLFCKDEILLWLEKSSKCPITQQSLTKGQLKAPGILLQSMLKDLVMYCSNRCYGCNWKGPQSNVQDHSVRCLEVLHGQHLAALREKDGEVEIYSLHAESLHEVKRSWESMCDFFKDHIPDHTLSVAEQTDQEVDSQLSALLQDDKTAFALLSFLDDSETQLQRLRGKQLLGEILRLTGTVEGLDVRMAAIEAQLTHTLRLLEGVLVREGSATDAAADSALPSPPPPQLPQLLSSLSGELSEGDVKPTATTPPTPGASSRHTHAHVLPLPSYICDLPPAPLPPSPLVEAVPVDWAALETELLSLFASVRALDPLLVPLVGPFLPSAAAAQEREEALGVVRRGLRLSGGGVVGLDGGVAELVPPLPHDPLCLFVLSSRAGAGGGGGGGGVVPWYVALCEALLIMKDKTDASAAAALAVDASAAAAAAAAAAAVGLEESAEGSSRTSSPILGIAPPSPALGALRIADIKCYRLPAQTSNHNHNNANTSSSGGLHAAFSQSLSPATTSSTALHPSALGIAASASMSASGTTNNSNAFALSAANTPRATFQQPLQPSPQQAAQQQAHRVAVEVSGPLTGSVRVQVEALCRPQH
eukprot:gene31515-38090_t